MEQITKVLIIGSKGMAGHMLYHYLKLNTDFSVVDIARGNDSHNPTYQLDVTDFAALHKVLVNEKPSIVINCIGILNKEAEDHPDKAILLNSYFPHYLAKRGDELGFKLIHISTDCVFNGKKGGYTEESVKDGIGFYAQTKAMGEVVYGDHLTLRTSIIGPELKESGIGLFHWFMKQSGSVKGYKNAYWTGVTTLDLSKAIVEAVHQKVTGLHHLVNQEKISKFDLINLFKKIFNRTEILIEGFEDYKVDKSLVKTNYSFDYSVPSYDQMVEEMSVWMHSHEALYKHYFN